MKEHEASDTLEQTPDQSSVKGKMTKGHWSDARAVLRASSTRANLQWNGVQGARQLHSHKSGGHCGRKSKEANPLQRLRAREQTHCTKKQKYPQGCSAVRAVRDGPELSRVAKHSVNLARVPGR